MGTNFQYGLQSRGVPVEALGGHQFYGFWGTTSWFVDHDNGSDSNSGKTPAAAFKNLDKAISSCAAKDVIYIRPKTTSANDPGAIIPESTTANWSVARAKEGIAIVGAGHTVGYAVQYTYLKGAASGTTGPVLDIQASGTTVENLAFHRGGVTSNGLLRFYGDGTTANNANYSAANNCIFRWYNQTGHAVTIVDSWFVGVYNSSFDQCKTGIQVRGLQSTIKHITIDGCLFTGFAADISEDIQLAGSNSDFLVIRNCDFAHLIPTGGTNKYISAASGMTSNNGMIVGCRFADNVTVGTEISTITNMKIVDCYDSAGAINTGS